jgi:hypothetical protein
MALNWVPIYNDREGGNVPVDAMILTSFDRGAGAQCSPSGYHYHVSGEFYNNRWCKFSRLLRDGFQYMVEKTKMEHTQQI